MTKACNSHNCLQPVQGNEQFAYDIKPHLCVYNTKCSAQDFSYSSNWKCELHVSRFGKYIQVQCVYLGTIYAVNVGRPEGSLE